MKALAPHQTEALKRLLSELVNQHRARVLVWPYRNELGYWFGGGSLVRDADGAIWLSGRYRNHGDSRTGLQAGQRGLECSVLRSTDGGQTFEKVRSWSKEDLSQCGRRVLSIEGTALHQLADGTWELFVSSEKEFSYPESVRHYQKPGTGVWTIDRLAGPSMEGLGAVTTVPMLGAQDHPECLHVKDPVVFVDAAGDTQMLFCSHPYNWTSSNTGLAERTAGQSSFHVESWEVVSRGFTWDVAATRITDRMPVPNLGLFADVPACAVYFYDGAECLRPHEESPLARKRARGYSCEEIGGALWGWDECFPMMERLSRLEPLFVSPWGTGCSRYVHTLVMEDGILATWQQSQVDGSQPLVSHWLSMDEIGSILAG
jgi:hypothetical protein